MLQYRRVVKTADDDDNNNDNDYRCLPPYP